MGRARIVVRKAIPTGGGQWGKTRPGVFEPHGLEGPDGTSVALRGKKEVKRNSPVPSCWPFQGEDD